MPLACSLPSRSLPGADAQKPVTGSVQTNPRGDPLQELDWNIGTRQGEPAREFESAWTSRGGGADDHPVSERVAGQQLKGLMLWGRV